MQPMPLLAMCQTAGGLETVIDMGGLLRPDAMFDPALRVRRQEVPDSRMRICIYLCVTVNIKACEVCCAMLVAPRSSGEPKRTVD